MKTIGKPDAASPLAAVTLLLFICLFGLLSWPRPAAAGEVTPAASPGEEVAALVNGQEITARELQAFCTETGMSHSAGLEELIDLQLLRTAAAAKGISAPDGPWGDETRARIESSLARVLALDLPAPVVLLEVDHAWLKDAGDEKGFTTGSARLEQLRKAVLAGETIPAAFERLRFDGSDWHIGDHEEYPAETLPSEVRQFPPGSLSPVIAGDGGRHLFKIHSRKEMPLPAEAVHRQLRDYLLGSAAIEIIGN